MTGEVDLYRLLAGLDPVLHDGEYVFVTLPHPTDLTGLSPILSFDETEGRTLVLLRHEAEAAGLVGEFPCAWITLRIHSSLEAVGMMAVIAKALAEAGISCNAVSAYYHDHIFVQHHRARDAVAVLRDLAGRQA